MFLTVGAFSLATDVAPDGTVVQRRTTDDGGRTGGQGWGFHGRVDLGGFVPQTHPDSGAPLWYRFRYRTADGAGAVTGSLVGRAVVAEQYRLRPGFRFDRRQVVVSGSGGGGGDERVLVPTSGTGSPESEGWVPVLQDDDGGFDLVGTGYQSTLLQVDTRRLVPGGAPAGTAPDGSLAPTERGGEVTFEFQTTVDDGTGSPSTTDVETHDSVTLYVNNWEEVRELSVVDAAGDEIGCAVTDTATVRYAVDHEFLRSYSVSLDSPAHDTTAGLPTSLAARTVDRGVHPHGTETGLAAEIDLASEYTGSGGTPAFADWPSCSYFARLGASRALTDGREDDDGDATRPADGVFYKQ
jgi:hypothetical protein